MILGIGIDLVDIRRIERAYERWGRRFLERVYNVSELENIPKGPRRWEYLAGRFAAKEAFLKALGTGIGQGIGLGDVWTVSEDSGRPIFCYSERLRSTLNLFGVKQAHLSITHESSLAIAMVVLEG